MPIPNYINKAYLIVGATQKERNNIGYKWSWADKLCMAAHYSSESSNETVIIFTTCSGIIDSITFDTAKSWIDKDVVLPRDFMTSTFGSEASSGVLYLE